MNEMLDKARSTRPANPPSRSDDTSRLSLEATVTIISSSAMMVTDDSFVEADSSILSAVPDTDPDDSIPRVESVSNTVARDVYRQGPSAPASAPGIFQRCWTWIKSGLSRAVHYVKSGIH
jgi:hypothetical protein